MEHSAAEVAFLEAVRSGSRHLVVPNGVSVNCRDESGNTALHIACYGDFPRIVRRLLRLGASVAAAGSKGYTPLHAAAQVGSAPLVRLLLESLNTEERNRVKLLKNSNGETALHVASFNGHTDIAMCLITEYCCDPDITDSYGRTCLHLACIGRHVDIVNRLVSRKNPLQDAASIQISFEYVPTKLFKCDVNRVDSLGKCPMHYACELGDLGIVRTLYECGADTNIRDGSGNACLHIAASSGHRAIVNALIGECGADPGLKGSGEETVLHSASRNGHEGVVRDLLSIHRCNPLVRDANSHTPLHVAAKFGRNGAVGKLLEECPADVLDKNGDTPLHLACEEGHTDTIRDLVARGSSVEVCNVWGITPLQAAALNGEVSAVEVLVSELGCDRSTIDPIHLLLIAEDSREASAPTCSLTRERVIQAFGYKAIIDG